MALINTDVRLEKIKKVKRQLESGSVSFRDVIRVMHALEVPLNEIRSIIIDCANTKYFVLVNPPKAVTSDEKKRKVLHKLYMGEMALERAIWYLRAEGVEKKELFYLLEDMIDEIYDHIRGKF